MGRKGGASAKASHILISYEGTQVPNKKRKTHQRTSQSQSRNFIGSSASQSN